MKSCRFLLALFFSFGFFTSEVSARSSDLVIDPFPFSFDNLAEISDFLPAGAQLAELASFMKRAQRQSEDTRLFQTEVPELDPTDFGGSYNIIHQDIFVDIDPDTGEMETWITTTFDVNEDDIYILPLLFPNTLEIDSITLDGENVDANHVAGTIALTTQAPLATDAPHSITLHAVGSPQCGGGMSSGCHFGSSQLNYITHGEYFPHNPTTGLDLFKARLQVRVPNPVVVAGTGRLVDIVPVEGEDKTTYIYDHDFETVFVSFSMGLYEMPSTDAASIPITAFIREKNIDNADTILNAAASIVSFYEGIYLNFPFLNLDVVEIHNSFSGGYGPQATIMMLSDVFEATPDSYYYDYLLQLMSHEIGHQWWGNMVSIGDTKSVTLSEGLAEFSSGLHSELELQSFSPFISNSMNYMYTVPPDQEIPLSSVLLYGSQYYQTLAYDKASSVFNMLRHELGEDLFEAGIQNYIETNAYSAANLDDFFDAMEEASGVDLDWFYEQWFIGTGYPRFSMETEPFVGDEEGSYYLRVTVEQQGESLYSMHLPIAVIYDRDHRREELDPIWIENESVTRVYRIEGPVFRVSPDSNKTMLQRTRSTLEGDVNLSGEVDGSDLVDMAVLYQRNIVFNTDNGNFFWPNGSYLPRFDLNSDGKIDESDIELLMNAF